MACESMNTKIKGLLSFAFDGVILTFILENLSDVPQMYQGNDLTLIKLYILLAAFIGFLFLGYGLMQIVKEKKQGPS
jgi:Na+-translocating ferredoxin:NAD+ oxidoreductase RnfA subunit